MCACGRRRGTVGAAVRRHGGNARQEFLHLSPPPFQSVGVSDLFPDRAGVFPLSTWVCSTQDFSAPVSA